MAGALRVFYQMKTAEFIVRVLDAAENRYDEDNDIPEMKKYIAAIKERYRKYRIETDFKSAARQARIETVEQILIEQSK